jgi:hypothetical protein
MADNETSIALPGQTDEAEAALAGAVQASSQAANQHIEPGEAAVPSSSGVATPAESAAPTGKPGTPGPLGDIISTQ